MIPCIVNSSKLKGCYVYVRLEVFTVSTESLLHSKPPFAVKFHSLKTLQQGNTKQLAMICFLFALLDKKVVLDVTAV